ARQRQEIHKTNTNVFFFSSRRRHTRSKRDWSSDVCSSDLKQGTRYDANDLAATGQYSIGNDPHQSDASSPVNQPEATCNELLPRSEERRVGKGCRPGWWP